MWWLVLGKHVLTNKILPHNTAQISVTKHEVHTMIATGYNIPGVDTHTHTCTHRAVNKYIVGIKHINLLDVLNSTF